MKRVIFGALIMIVLLSFSTIEQSIQKDSSKPVANAFIISEKGLFFENLDKEYATNIQTVFDNDIQKAFTEWQNTLSQINDYLLENHIEIEATKVWIKIFWAADGTMDYIAFDVKKYSSDKNKNKIAEALNDFVNKYNQTTNSTKNTVKYNHFGSFTLGH